MADKMEQEKEQEQNVDSSADNVPEPEPEPEVVVAATSDAEHAENTNVFRLLFATLETEHRKLHDLEQRRLKLAEEMKNLRKMLDQENRKLRSKEEKETKASKGRSSSSSSSSSSNSKPSNLPHNVDMPKDAKARGVSTLDNNFECGWDAEPVVLIIRSETDESDDVIKSLPALFNEDKEAELPRNVANEPDGLISMEQAERELGQHALSTDLTTCVDGYELPNANVFTPPIMDMRDITVESESVIDNAEVKSTMESHDSANALPSTLDQVL